MSMACEEERSTLPQDIITSILHRLPAKSLGQFCCVSKGWLSLISQPQFIKNHRKTLNQNHLIFLSTRRSLHSLPFSHLETKTKPKLTNLVLEKHHADIFTFHGSCNGLVLSSAYNLHDGKRPFVLNPITRDFIELPEFGNEMIKKFDTHTLYGFGYDFVTDDYKVVTISCLIPPKNMFVHVFSLRNNTWKQVSDSPYNHSCGKSMSGVLVNGFLHWIAKKGSNVLPIIVAFSLADEKFSEVPSPNIDCNSVFALGEKLAVYMKVEGAIWLMNEYGVKESWTKILIPGLNEIPMVEPMIYYDHGKIMFLTRDQMMIYDMEEQTLSERVNNSWNLNILEVEGAYVESLVSPRFGRNN